MHRILLAATLAAAVYSQTQAAPATQVSACDLNGDQATNVIDIQLAVNMVLGLSPCTARVTGPGVCDIVMIQRVTNAAVSGNCVTGLVSHSVILTWTASVSPNVAAYNVYRATRVGGPYAKLNPVPVIGTAFTDIAAQAGQTYYYVTTAVDKNNNEGGYSVEAQAVIPAP